MLYSFGYQGLRGSGDLSALLRDTRVKVVVDIRLSPFSGNRAFSLATRRTVEDAGFVYLHERGLGNLGYKRGTIEIADMERIEVVLAMLRVGQSVALLCACREPARCHRSVLSEEAVRREPGLQIVHLKAVRTY